jgi:hypothetical protein
MTPIPGRWHDDSGVLDLNPPAPATQAALAFALYGLRLQAEGISPGPVEATITIADRTGHLMGRLDLDARDAQWMVDAISGKLEIDYGPWRAESVDRLLTDHAQSNPYNWYEGR